MEKMELKQIKEKLNSNEYDFLRNNEHLGKNIILLGLGGSHAYGTATETSDLDVRGCALRSKREILINQGFEQVEDDKTDTTIYSFDKLVSLLLNMNPNVCEIFGLKSEHYLYVSRIGQELLDNVELFVSKKCINSFRGYACQQLYRLKQATIGMKNQSELEEHIMNTARNMIDNFHKDYTDFPDDSINLYIDKSDQEDYDTEIYMDIILTHYPLRDWKNMWSVMNSMVKSYSKVGKRNKHAIEHEKLGKHMCHLIRLYIMVLDILEHDEIITYRENEHDLLMSIRNGAYLDENKQPIPEFFEMVDEYERKLEYAKENTDLPERPDYAVINEFVASVNERVVRGEI